jgi:ketosteroid isomerase-like protein
MSSENVEIVRRLVQAFNRRDLAGMSQMFDREIEWEPGGPAAVERAVYRGSRRGVQRVRRDLGDLGRVSSQGERASRSGGLDCVAGARPNAGGASHVELDQEFAIHFLVRGNKIVRVQGFRGWQEALEAAALGPRGI